MPTVTERVLAQNGIHQVDDEVPLPGPGWVHVVRALFATSSSCLYPLCACNHHASNTPILALEHVHPVMVRRLSPISQHIGVWTCASQVVHSAGNLLPVDGKGKCNPYVSLQYFHDEKRKKKRSLGLRKTNNPGSCTCLLCERNLKSACMQKPTSSGSRCLIPCRGLLMIRLLAE